MSNLLKDASILLTPTAYENGRMNAIKPYKDLYGPELVTNGDFSNGLTSWSAYGVTSVSSGIVTIGASANSGIFQGILTQGKKYKVTINVTSYDGVGNAQVINDYGNVLHTITTTGLQTFYFEHSISNVNIIIRATASGVLSVSSFSVVEDLSGDFQFSRNSAATRVNAQGLVENVQIISPELVSNGNFSQIGTEEVSNGNFSQEGSELVTNGDFENGSTGWSIAGSNLSIANGKATSTGSNFGAQFKQTILTTNKFYKITFDIVDYTGGAIGLTANYYGEQNVFSSVGTHTAYFTSLNQTELRLYSENFVGSIDNVSVKEVGQDWTIENTWTIGDGVANGNGANGSGEELISNSSSLPIGTYKIVFEIKDYVSGGVIPYLLGATETFSSNGVHTVYKTITSASGLKFRGVNFIGSITNISVKEVGQDWTFGSGWSMGDGYAFTDGTVNQSLEQNNVATVGRKYRISFDITRLTSGVIDGRVRLNSIGRLSFSDEGSYSADIIADGSSLRVTALSGNAASWSLDNISVKEITDDTDLPRINYEGFSYQDSLGSELVVNGDFATDSNWNKDVNWSIADGIATSTGSGRMFQYISFLESNVGTTVKVSFDITDNSNGGVVVNCYGGISQLFTGVGTHTFTTTTTNTTNLYFNNAGAGGNFVGSIDNVSVKEYLGQEVVPDSGCGSWLLEPQRTNGLLQSNQFDTTWLPTSASVASGQTGVGGSSDAWLLECTTTASSARITQTVSLTGDLSYSFYAKKGTTDSINLRSNDSGTATWFNLSSGVVHSTGSNASNAQIKDVGNGWYRCSVVFNSCTSVRIYLSDSVGSYVVTDGANVYIQYSQLELGGYATSYIPTNGATNTRLQDIASNSGNSTLINSTEGVLYAEIAALTNGGSNRQISISDGTNSNVVILRLDFSDTSITSFIRGNGGSYTIETISSITKTNNNKIALVWNATNLRIWVNGVESGSAAVNDLPIGLDTLSFNEAGGGGSFYGKNKALAVYKEALTDAQLQCLTTI